MNVGDPYPEPCLQCRQLQKACVKAKPQTTKNGEEKKTKKKSCGPCVVAHKGCSWDEEESDGSDAEVPGRTKAQKEVALDTARLLQKLVEVQKEANVLQEQVLWEKRHTNELLEDLWGMQSSSEEEEVEDEELEDLRREQEEVGRVTFREMWEAADRERAERKRQSRGVMRQEKESEEEEESGEEEEEEKEEDKEKEEDEEEDEEEEDDEVMVLD
ncbi:hypothetical protein QCA50_005104 [Cerrena zonata]|uniref:Uncharacterized protein n=1 Tax=Cerrena zonata TaxID=2478898 RepID=A0AAW0GQ45_9APHY